MKNQITLEEAQELLKKHLHEQYLLHHSRETEVIMRALAKHFGEDEEFWGLTGLLHDLDMEEIGTDYAKHGDRTVEILQEEGYDIPEMFQTIKSHTENLGFTDIKRESKFEYSLSAAENISGFIVAYTLMRPDKKLENVTVKSIKKKLKDKSFAAKVNRELINDIEKTGLERSEFLQIAIDAMKGIAGEIGFQ
ncbi:MAG: HD domain-containing protein [Patescibacteria group bacterium]|nr:HDIG domain-containing protein [Patescibacteria group bacterium]